MKIEGIIAKRADSLYSSDAHSGEWLKLKAKLRQEVVITGYTRNENSAKNSSALAVGIYDAEGVLRSGATVSMPLDWDQVRPGLTMCDFTIRNAPGGLREAGDFCLLVFWVRE